MDKAEGVRGMDMEARHTGDDAGNLPCYLKPLERLASGRLCLPV